MSALQAKNSLMPAKRAKALNKLITTAALAILPVAAFALQPNYDPSILPQYPQIVAGFSRTDVIMYAADYSDYSLDYDFTGKAGKIHDTYYLYDTKVAPDFAKHYAGVKDQVTKVHPAAKLVVEGTQTITRNGKTYNFLQAEYALHENYYGSEQDLYSEVLLAKSGNKYIMLRSTGPIAERDEAFAKNLAFLSAIPIEDN